MYISKIPFGLCCIQSTGPVFSKCLRIVIGILKTKIPRNKNPKKQKPRAAFYWVGIKGHIQSIYEETGGNKVPYAEPWQHEVTTTIPKVD